MGKVQLHGQRHELLLGAVVDVSFQPPALLVLSRDQPVAGGPEVLDQPHVALLARLLKQPAGLGLLLVMHRAKRTVGEEALAAQAGVRVRA